MSKTTKSKRISAKKKKGPGNNGFVSKSEAGQRTVEETVNKSVRSSVLPEMRGGRQNRKQRVEQQSLPRRKELKKKFAVRSKDLEYRKLQPRLARWFDALANPWGGEGVRCPVNYNPVPTMMASTARTTVTKLIQVPATTSFQYDMFPGHGSATETDSMDGVAYHGAPLTVNATNFSIGPVNDGTHTATNVVQTTALNSDPSNGTSASMALNTAASSALTYDVGLPYTAQAGKPYHTRWKLSSMGVKIANVTPELSRGGAVFSVQPSTPFSSTTISDHERFPTFQTSSRANEGTLTLSWIPRPEDLAFWHKDSDAAATIDPMVAGLRFWLSNPTAGAQSYELSFVFNWEVAGANLAAIASPSAHQPADKSIVDPALEVARFNSPTASNLGKIATAIAATASPFADKLSNELAGHAMNGIGKVATAALMTLI